MAQNLLPLSPRLALPSAYERTPHSTLRPSCLRSFQSWHPPSNPRSGRGRNHSRARRAPLSESLAINRRALELGWRATVNRSERRAEVAMAGKAQLQAERGQVVIFREEVQRPCQPQSKLIAIQG